jgi:sigma-B regulation protein RsbU (phosphoserine phosphatase)
MLWSIRTRLALAGILLVLLTAGSLMWFAHKDTISALRSSERRSLNNIMYLLERDLGSTHAQELKTKLAAAQIAKQSLARAATAALALMAEAGSADTAALSLWAKHPANPAIHTRFLRRSPDGLWRDCLDNARPVGPAEALLPALAPGDQEFFLQGEDGFALVERRADHAVIVSRSSAPQTSAGEAYNQAVSKRFQDLLSHVSVQKTGFAAVLDSAGNILIGPKHAAVPPKLKETLQSGFAAGTARRVMILPSGNAPDAPQVLYLLGYFRPLRWHIVLAAPLDELEAPAVSLVAGQLWITLAVTGGGLLLGLVLAQRIAGPVRRLTRVARTLPERDILNLNAESLRAELPAGRRDEVGELARAFSHMAAELHDNVTRLVEFTTIQERMQSELQVARDIQYGILPGPFAKNPAVDLFASMRTAKAVGGDLYDYFFLDDRRLCFVIGDVSDKSVPAALFMSMAVTFIRVALRDTDIAPNEAAAKVNDALARDNPRNMFVTLIIAVLDIETGKVLWSSAGHMPPILLTAEGASNLETSGDMMAGVFDGIDFRLLEYHMRPGEALFLYTDGVSEAMNPDKELYGEKRLLAELTTLRDKSAEEIAGNIYDAVAKHADGAEQSDDIAVMAVRWYGPADKSDDAGDRDDHFVVGEVVTTPTELANIVADM